MQYTLKVNGFEESYEIEKFAKQASGAVMLKIGKTAILATVAREDKPVEEDFLPLTVQYIEKAYAAGKIPGGYIKRETKPSDAETLTARIIDRSLRPLFPKGYAYPTQIVVMVLSADPEVDLQVASLNAASISLFLSDIQIKAPVCGVRIAKIQDKLVLNPSNSELKNSSLDLYVSGVKDELLMIEMRALASKNANEQLMNEMNEYEMIQALEFAQKAICEASNTYEQTFIKHIKTSDNIKLKLEQDNEKLSAFIEENYLDEIKNAIMQMAKSERAMELEKIAKEIAQNPSIKDDAYEEQDFINALNKIKRKVVRKAIIEEGKRADGRDLNEVRPISIETNLLQNAHGSCLFTRGQTQALVVATLGTEADAQMSENLIQKTPIAERFMFNYNFPGFSVGEASPIKAPGRRELGHGNLAKRALYPSIELDYPLTIRLVSEILESNGSSSMASVCGGSLALRAAGVKSLKLVAGVAMGLVFEEGKSAILTDIMGLEDHDGDMDFKVAGTYEGITALQMDIKLGGIDKDTLQKALYQAKEARLHILKLMLEAQDQIIINEEILPKIELFNVEPSKIVDIIGQGGKTIKEIIEKFEVSIDLDKEKGEVKITASNANSLKDAKEFILQIIAKESKFGKKREFKNHAPFQIGEEFVGKVKNITSFGVFIELRDGIDGLLHSSKFQQEFELNDEIKVSVEEIKNGKISLKLA